MQFKVLSNTVHHSLLAIAAWLLATTGVTASTVPPGPLRGPSSNRRSGRPRPARAPACCGEACSERHMQSNLEYLRRRLLWPLFVSGAAGTAGELPVAHLPRRGICDWSGFRVLAIDPNSGYEAFRFGRASGRRFALGTVEGKASRSTSPVPAPQDCVLVLRRRDVFVNPRDSLDGVLHVHTMYVWERSNSTGIPGSPNQTKPSMGCPLTKQLPRSRMSPRCSSPTPPTRAMRSDSCFLASARERGYSLSFTAIANPTRSFASSPRDEPRGMSKIDTRRERAEPARSIPSLLNLSLR